MATSVKIRPFFSANIRLLFQRKRYEKLMTAAIEEENNEVEKLYKSVGDQFSDPPVFIKRVNKGFLGSLSGEVTTESKPFIFIDQGTNQRFAIMSGDFIPRTTKGSLVVKPKRGHVVRRGYAAGDQGPIEAREFTQTIAKMRKKPFADKMQEAINKAS